MMPGSSKLQFATLVGGMMVPVAAGISYNEARAIEYSKFSGAAYCEASAVKNWDCGYKCDADLSNVQVCQGQDTQAYVGRWSSNQECLVAFEGTSNIASAWTDLQFYKSGTKWADCDGCRIHSGFLDEWYSLKDCIQTSLGNIGCGAGEQSLYVTGHSLGAAVSGIAMMGLSNSGWTIAEGYNFGMPRTGDADWATAFNAKFSDRFFRITHHKDPVPQVPPDTLIVNWHFEHVEPEIFYDGTVGGGHKQCSDPSDETCSHQYWNLLVDQFHIEDHLDYMGTQTSLFGCEAKSQCYSAAYAYCCDVGTPCNCEETTDAPGQCDYTAFNYCCRAGTPCECSEESMFQLV